MLSQATIEMGTPPALSAFGPGVSWLSMPTKQAPDNHPSPESVIERLIADGRISVASPSLGNTGELSLEERRELADKFGRAPGRLLSQIVIDDRGDK